MKHFLTLIFITMLTLSAIGENTSRKQLKLKDTPAPEQTSTADTLQATAGLVTITGYDKPLRSSWETFFVVNNSDFHISAINITFTYFDLNNHQLHSTTTTVTADIPPMETRQLRIPAWDRQHAFYYHLNPPARATTSATPFTLIYTLNYLISTPQQPLDSK